MTVRALAHRKVDAANHAKQHHNRADLHPGRLFARLARGNAPRCCQFIGLCI
jgi:hypothetical protein